MSARRLALSILTLTLAGCTCSDPATPAVTPEQVAATPTPVVDPIKVQLEALRAAADTLPAEGPEREAGLAALVDLSRAVGEAALSAGRSDALSEAADVAYQAGAERFAAALLQRATGLLDPAEAGKDHLWSLARIRRDEGRVLEAVSLLERAVHVEPTRPAEWLGLSEGYLLADRVGPARAAITRGLRVHEGNMVLKTQGAAVMLVSGRAEQALGILDEVLRKAPDEFGAKVVRAETLLVLGRIEEAVAVAKDFGDDDAWAAITRGAALGLSGDATGRDAALAAAEEIAGDCPCTATERAAIVWARGLKAGEPATPRPRVHPEAQAPKLAGPKAASPKAASPKAASPSPAASTSEPLPR